MISSKEWIILFIGIVGSLIIGVFSKTSKIFSNGDFIILFILVATAIVFIIGKKVEENRKSIEEHRIEIDKLTEKLKINNELVDIKARIISLETKNGKK